MAAMSDLVALRLTSKMVKAIIGPLSLKNKPGRLFYELNKFRRNITI